MAFAPPGRRAASASAAHPRGGIVSDHDRAQLDSFRRWRSRTRLPAEDVEVGGNPR
jgi:hypothetical protein